MRQVSKEDFVRIFIVLVFVLGFFVLINNSSITGTTVLDNSTNNNLFITENFTFGIEATVTVQLQAPVNNTNTTSLTNNFIFNASSDTSNVTNCSLFLNINSAGYILEDTVYNGGSEWLNMSDAINLGTEIACVSPYSMTTNGTDFWIGCTNNAATDRYIYHLNSTFDNQSDYMNVSVAKTGNIWIFGLTTNNSDFWFMNEDNQNSFVYHLDANGNNITDGFNFATCCSSSGNVAFPTGLTTNGTDFWILDKRDMFIYHTNLTGYNYSDGFSISGTGATYDAVGGLTTNGSDFWFNNYADDFIYHVNASGDNQTDGIKVSTLCGSGSPWPITTPSFIIAENEGGSPDEFWFIDYSDATMYHITAKFNETANHTISKTFSNIDQTINWKISCYDNNSDNFNSSIRNLTIDVTSPTVNITFPKNNTNYTTPYINFTYNTSDSLLSIDSCVLWLQKAGSWELNYTDTSITETINQTINITVDDQNMLWLVECNDTANNRGNSTTYNITVDTGGPAVDITLPKNNTNSSTKYINFTYNATDAASSIDSCILWLYKTDWELNYTDTSITETINQTINITVDDISTLWKVECNDTLNYRANSTTYNITVDSTAPNVNLVYPSNTTLNTKHINFTYNVTDNLLNIDSCILWLLKNNVWELNFTDTSITETINQTINLTVEDSTIEWRVECNDTVNNRDNSSMYKLTIDTSVASEDVTGGISRSTSQSATTKITTIQQGLINIVEFNNPFIPVISIELQLNQEATLKLKVKKVFASFLSNKVDNAYSYFKIEANIADDGFEFINLNFKVKKSYGNVGLYQLFDQGNNEIEITQIYEDEKYIYYQAPLNSLGYFAVTAEQHKKLLSGSVTKTLAKFKVQSNIVSILLVLILIGLVVLVYKGKKFKRVKIFGAVSFSLLIIIFLSSNMNLTGFWVKTFSTGSLIGILIFVILVIIIIIAGLIYLIKFKPKGKIPINKEVRFKLLARIIINKLNAGRVMEVEKDYNKLIILYKKIIVGKDEFEIRELYNIIENVYEKYYSEIMKLHNRL